MTWHILRFVSLSKLENNLSRIDTDTFGVIIILRFEILLWKRSSKGERIEWEGEYLQEDCLSQSKITNRMNYSVTQHVWLMHVVNLWLSRSWERQALICCIVMTLHTQECKTKQKEQKTNMGKSPCLFKSVVEGKNDVECPSVYLLP